MARAGSKKGTAGKRLSEFAAEKPAANPLPIYVLRGTDPYLLDRGRQVLRKRVLGDADPQMALVELSGAEADLGNILDALRTAPFLAPRRLVILRDADAFLAPQNQGEHRRNTIQKYLEHPAPTGTLALEVSKWNETTRLAKQVAKVGCLVLCEPLEPRKIPSWLQRRAKEHHAKTLTFGAAQMLQEYLGGDFAGLVGAIEMLALYVGDAPTIDIPDVDALIARGHHERVWDLCDAVGERRLARALALLDAFWTEGMVPPQIVGLLRTTFRQLVHVRAFATHMSVDAAMDHAGVPRPAFNRVRRAVTAFTDDDLAEAYQALVDADLETKTTPNDRLAMETLMHRLCGAGAMRRVGAASGP